MKTKLKRLAVLVKAYLKILMKQDLCYCLFQPLSSKNLVTLHIGNVNYLAKGPASTDAQQNHIC